ncbi:uncharacterized protein LOC114802493 [Denticeps clupeoides]|uniref:Uncharacterized protein n=1 Tax=Denticeps clupeoides TaxID=299321 RepID=A0AAY4ELV5_9TELE|nr:uncharacterized protein LOC114802493 [Denticeps clupeoides]
MASSKSSQTTRNIIIGILAVWSIISLIIIVVWATSPDLKGASQCRGELQTLNQKMEDAKVTWMKDKKALEDLVLKGWENQTLLQKQIDLYKEQLRGINTTLSDCQEENVDLNRNITSLENEIEMQKAIEANLTAELSLQKEEIDNLQHNLTVKSHDLISCQSSRAAAAALQTAAESDTAACQANQQHIQKQLQRCQLRPHTSESSNAGSRVPAAGALVLSVLLCKALVLMS